MNPSVVIMRSGVLPQHGVGHLLLDDCRVMHCLIAQAGRDVLFRQDDRAFHFDRPVNRHPHKSQVQGSVQVLPIELHQRLHSPCVAKAPSPFKTTPTQDVQPPQIFAVHLPQFTELDDQVLPASMNGYVGTVTRDKACRPYRNPQPNRPRSL